MPCASLCSASFHFPLFIFHFTLFLCFPLAGTLWMNWCMVAICAPCIPLLCLCSLLTFHISLFIFHFTLFLCFPLAGTLWMNWCMVAICALCIPLLCLFSFPTFHFSLHTFPLLPSCRHLMDELVHGGHLCPVHPSALPLPRDVRALRAGRRQPARSQSQPGT